MSTASYAASPGQPFDRRQRQGVSRDGVEHRSGRDRREQDKPLPEGAEEKRRGFRDRVKSAAGAVADGTAAAGRRAVVTGKRAIGPTGRRVVGKSVAAAPAATKHTLTHNVLKGTAAAALLLGGGAATYNAISEDTPGSPLTDVPNQNHLTLMRNEMPGAQLPSGFVLPDDTRSVERIPVATAVPAEQISAHLEVPAEKLLRYSLVLQAEDGKIQLKAVPFSNSGKIISTDYHDNRAINPLKAIAGSATKAQQTHVLDEWRSFFHKKGYAYVPKLKGIPYRDSTLLVQEAAQRDFEKAKPIGTLETDDSIILDINMGGNGQAALEWLRQLVELRNELLRAIDDELLNHPIFVDFIKNAVTDPKTGQYDPQGELALLSIFSLPPQDREEFKFAVWNNDLPRATEILLFRSSQPPITAEAFTVIEDYVRRSLQAGLTPADISNGFREGIYDYAYKDLATSDNKAVKIFRDSIDENHFNAIGALPNYLLDFIATYIASEKHLNYYGFLNDFRAILNDSQKSSEHAIPQVLPHHTFHALQSYSNEFLTTNGWVDLRDKEHNLLHLLDRFKQRAMLNSMSLDMASPKAFLDHTLQRIGGNDHFVMVLPKEISDANNLLSMWSRVILGAQQHILPGQRYNDKGEPRPLSDRLDEFCASITNFSPTQSRWAGPNQLIQFLAGIPALPKEMKGLVSGKSPEGITFSEAFDFDGIRLRTISQSPETSFVSNLGRQVSSEGNAASR